jgi:hypothetical protein
MSKRTPVPPTVPFVPVMETNRQPSFVRGGVDSEGDKTAGV